MSLLTNQIKKIKEWTEVFYLSWEIDESNTKEFENILESALNTNIENFILNIKNLTYVNSSVIWIIVQKATAFSDKWKEFVFSECNEDIYEIFDLVWLHYAINFFKTDEDALAHFQEKN